MVQIKTANMEVTVRRSTIIAHRTLDAEPTEIPLTIFDRFATNISIAVLFAFSPPTPSNEMIVEGLIKTLAYFPTLVGELAVSRSGRPCILLGGDDGGALLVETTVASKLVDHLPLEPSPDLLLLHPQAEPVAAKLFQVQLNRFECGGLVVGATAHHRVADGQAMGSFFVAWGRTVRGLPIDPLPVYGGYWLEPHRPPRCEFQHWGIEFMPIPPHQNGFSMNPVDVEPDKIMNIRLRYTSDYITSELKASMPDKYTTFVTLLGHLWRKITIARGLDDEEYTQIRVSVNGRSRLKPPVPQEFFGNLVLNACPGANARALIEGGIAGAAKIVHEAIRRTSDEYFRSFIDFGEIHGGENLNPCCDGDGNVLSPNLEVDSWLRFCFQDLDFGGGGTLCGFMPTWVPVDGLVFFLPPVRQDGGVDVVVTMLEEHARVLGQISHSLD